MASNPLISRSIATAALAAAALPLAACASPQTSGDVGSPQQEAGADAGDVSTDPPEAPESSDAPDDPHADQRDASAVDVSDGEGGATDYCSGDAGEASDAGGDAACTPSEVQTGRCGRCGVRERTCDPNGAWRDWSPCSESDQAECELCAVEGVGCGFCGTRALACRIVGDSCRWAFGVCETSGSCSPGSYETDAATCAPGSTRVRWCLADCSWDDWEPCSAQAPAWEPLGSAPLGPRTGFVSASTGSVWLLWGGRDPQGAALSDGASFDATTSTWSVLPPATLDGSDADAGADSGATEPFAGRSGAAAVWTGDELLIWGGLGANFSDVKGDGARLRPDDATWTAMSEVDAPSPRSDALMIWDDADGVAVVWGGQTANGSAAGAGATYSVSADQWLPSAVAPLAARLGATAVWDPLRRHMIVWGGRSAGGIVRHDGAAYDPMTDTWSPIADAPIAREGHVAIWDSTGDRMLVMLGRDGFWTGQRGDGAAWNASSDTWTMLSDVSVSGYAVGDGWSASFALGYLWVVGGDGSGGGASTAGAARYDVTRDAWSALPAMSSARSGHAAAFLDRLVVWGGRPGSSGWVDSVERLRSMP